MLNTSALYYFIYGTTESSRRARDALSRAISNLIASDVLYGSQLDKDNYIIERRSFNDDGAGFVVITSEELFALNEMGSEQLRYWCYLVATINNETKQGFASRKHFSEILGCSEKTISRYSARLKEAGLLVTSKKWTKDNKSIIYYSRGIRN